MWQSVSDSSFRQVQGLNKNAAGTARFGAIRAFALLLLMPLPLWANWINLTGAETAENIVEIAVSYAGMVDPRTRRKILGPPDDKNVVCMEIRYPLEGRQADQRSETP